MKNYTHTGICVYVCHICVYVYICICVSDTHTDVCYIYTLTYMCVYIQKSIVGFDRTSLKELEVIEVVDR